MKNIEIGWNKVFYKQYSAEKSKWIFLILHGRGGSSNSWEQVAEMLKKSWYNVFVPDLPGFGKTELWKIFDVVDYAEIMEKFVHKLDLKNIYLLGHSNWGRISILLENRAKIWIQKLFLNNSAGIKHLPSFRQRISKKMSKILKLFKWMPGYNFLRKILYKLVGGHDYLNIENNQIKKTFLNMIASDLKKEISNIKTDTILIWWAKDSYTPVWDGKLMHNLIKKSKLEILEDEKHWIHLHNPQKLVKIIKKNISD